MLGLRGIAFFLLSACVLAAGPAWTAELVLKSRSFRDSSTDERKVSGYSIVGVRLGEPPAAVNKDRIYVAISGKQETLPLCVRATTSDATFWSISEYAPGPSGTARLDYPTRFPELLSKYAGDTFAVHAVFTASCTSDSEGILVPSVLRPGEQPRSLTVFVNSTDAMIEAALHGIDGKAVTPTAQCAKSTGPRTAYQWNCRITFRAPLPAGDYQLRIASYTDTGRPGKPVTASIRLPGMNP